MNRPGESDALATARALTEALDVMSGQLETVGGRLGVAERYIRRSRHIIAALVVSLCLDLLITAGLGYNTVRQNSVQNSIRAADVRQCKLSNAARAQDVAIWNRLLKVPAGAASTAANRSEVADLERLVRVKDTPRQCEAAFKN